MRGQIVWSEQHEQIVAEVKSFTKAHKSLLAEEWPDDKEQALQILRALGASGLLEYTVPAAYGGRRESVEALLLCLAREHLAYAHTLADLMFAMQGLGSYPITLSGTPELKAQYLHGVATGGLIAAFAITEAGAGSDVSSMQTVAERDGDDYVLNGSKIYISNTGIADFYTVFARTDSGISAFVVDARTEGLGERRIKMLSPHPIGELTFKNCRISRSRLLGSEGEGFKIAMRTLDMFRSSVGAAALGFGRRALDESISYAKRRIQFGKPLAEFQAIQFKLADMYTELEAAALLISRAAYLKDSGERVTREAAMAKLFATEAAQRAIDECVQIHGGSGLVHGSIPERLYRDIRAMRIYEGTSEIQRLIIAGQLLKEAL